MIDKDDILALSKQTSDIKERINKEPIIISILKSPTSLYF